ncbi:excalibur calcium-binding domain-containing protein [Streptomyces venezuelae]|uniref:excalibur calcium-binding domain-containing protein n=1 Tax=Streptomyces venezuelae TaxID=54571 RepID=UPI0034120C28
MAALFFTLFLIMAGTKTPGDPEPAPTVTVTEPGPTVTETETAEASKPAVNDESPDASERTTDSPEPTATPTTESSSQQDAYYANCDEARAAGAAPLYAGDPGYSADLDRDGDGVACEPYAGP